MCKFLTLTISCCTALYPHNYAHRKPCTWKVVRPQLNYNQVRKSKFRRMKKIKGKKQKDGYELQLIEKKQLGKGKDYTFMWSLYILYKIRSKEN